MKKNKIDIVDQEKEIKKKEKKTSVKTNKKPEKLINIVDDCFDIETPILSKKESTQKKDSIDIISTGKEVKNEIQNQTDQPNQTNEEKLIIKSLQNKENSPGENEDKYNTPKNNEKLEEPKMEKLPSEIKFEEKYKENLGVSSPQSPDFLLSDESNSEKIIINDDRLEKDFENKFKIDVPENKSNHRGSKSEDDKFQENFYTGEFSKNEKSNPMNNFTNKLKGSFGIIFF